MENLRGTSSGLDRNQTSGRLIFEEFVPPSAWTEDSASHHLLVDLPGFKREDLKLQVENQTHIVVSGERQVKDNKYMRFEQKFLLPGNSDIGKITGKIEGEILYVSVPKRLRGEIKEQKKKETQQDDRGEEKEKLQADHPTPGVVGTNLHKEKKENNNDELDNGYGHENEKLMNQSTEAFHDANGDGVWKQRSELLANAVLIRLRKNKGIVITAVLAFSLGVFISQKFQSNRE